MSTQNCSFIFEEQIESELLNNIHGKLIINDVYPNQICRVCLENLRIAYELRLEFEKSESILKKCYKHVHPSTDKKAKTSCAPVPVEVIFGSNKFDLKDLVIVEEPQTTEVNFGGFLNNLGQSISAKFVNKQFGINSKQRSEIPDISVENNILKRSYKKSVRTPILSIDNVAKNNSSIVETRSLGSSIKMNRFEGQFQFALVDSADYGGFDEIDISQSSQICEEKNMVEEHNQDQKNVELIEFENQDNENPEGSTDKNELMAVETKKKNTNRESILFDQCIFQAENEYLETLANDINKNDSVAVRRKGKCGNRESILIDQYIIEAGKEYNKNLEIANDDDLIAKSNYPKVVNEKNEISAIAVGSKKKNHNRESRLIEQYIIEAGNTVEFDISEEPYTSEYLQLQINTATDDNLRHLETSEKQQANLPLTCKICKLKFKTRNSYGYHRLTKHFEQKYMCHFCGRKFHTKGSLSRHILSHTDKTTVLCICPVCGKICYYQGRLFYHMKQHTNERKYCCDYCARRFYTLTTKKRHQATHTGDRPYSCKACDKKFFSLGELCKHEYRHSVERPHHCEFCGKGFTSRFNMNMHLFSHPGDFICEVCNRGFITKDILKSHYISKHKNRIEEEAGNS